MKEYLKLAWRNIWRNKRRTLITAASIFFAVLFAILMRSFQLGSYDHMIHNAVESYSGYIQVQDFKYEDEKTIDHSFPHSDTLLDKVRSTKNVTYAVPRLESFALASSGTKTKGALVLGVDPGAEDRLTKSSDKLVKFKITSEAIEKIRVEENLPTAIIKKLESLKGKTYSSVSRLKLDLELENENSGKIISKISKHARFEGSYLEKEEKAVLVADRLGKFLNIGIGDTITLIGMGYHGRSAFGIYPVKGIVKFPSPDLDNQLIYMPLTVAQEFYGTGNRLTSLALNVDDKDEENINKTVNDLKEKLNTEKISVKSWRDMNRELVQQIESDNASGLIMLGILYLIIGFGVFGTVLMMTAERRKEFGVMIAVGMKKIKLAGIVTLEMLFIGLIGMMSGILMSIPGVLLGYYNPVRLTGDAAKSMEAYGIEPVMPFAWFGDYYFNQSIVVIVIVILASLYPIYSITKIKAVQALKD